MKRNFQACALRQLLRSDRHDAENYLRTKLRRWHERDRLITPIGTLTRRAGLKLTKAFTLVTPRVAIAMFRAWLNAWCTARRFQDRCKRCVFHCDGAGAEDSLEHYAHCQVVRDFARKSLQLPDSSVGRTCALLCLNRDVSDEIYTLQLLLLYAVYSATNSLRFGTAQVRTDHVQELL